MKIGVNHLAMFSYPHIAKLWGYTFKTGRSHSLLHDANRVLNAVYDAKGGTPPADLGHLKQHYEQAATWIVAYHHGQPVGVKALLDITKASIALDVAERELPACYNKAKIREISRLAIHPAHRGGRQVVMIGLLREMLKLAQDQQVELLLAGADRKLYHIYQRYNPTARLLDLPHREVSADVKRYFHYARASSPDPVLFMFDVAGAQPWAIFQRFLQQQLRPTKRSYVSAP